MQDNPSALLGRLSPRERQVLELIVGGSTLGEMAALIGERNGVVAALPAAV